MTASDLDFATIGCIKFYHCKKKTHYLIYLFTSIVNIVFYYFYFHLYNMFRIAGTLLVPVHHDIVSRPGVD